MNVPVEENPLGKDESYIQRGLLFNVDLSMEPPGVVTQLTDWVSGKRLALGNKPTEPFVIENKRMLYNNAVHSNRLFTFTQLVKDKMSFDLHFEIVCNIV